MNMISAAIIDGERDGATTSKAAARKNSSSMAGSQPGSSRKARFGAPIERRMDETAEAIDSVDAGGTMRTVAMSLLTAALVAAGTAIGAAPEQTSRPGDMTDAKVWIQNRSRAEAIPVNLRVADIETPLRVLVSNAETNPHAVRVTGPVRTQTQRQEWDYETVAIAPDSSLQALKSLGAAGWETTGVSWPSAQGTTLLLKRPR
jgi:hypothetical protein